MYAGVKLRDGGDFLCRGKFKSEPLAYEINEDGEIVWLVSREDIKDDLGNLGVADHLLLNRHPGNAVHVKSFFPCLSDGQHHDDEHEVIAPLSWILV